MLESEVKVSEKCILSKYKVCVIRSFVLRLI